MSGVEDIPAAMNGWMSVVRKGVAAVAGMLGFMASIYGGLAMLWLVMKAPDAFALVCGAAIIGAAIYFRKPSKTYHLQMSHPDTQRVLADISEMASRINTNTRKEWQERDRQRQSAGRNGEGQ